MSLGERGEGGGEREGGEGGRGGREGGREGGRDSQVRVQRMLWYLPILCRLIVASDVHVVRKLHKLMCDGHMISLPHPIHPSTVEGGINIVFVT